jgi:hypothetical protein
VGEKETLGSADGDDAWLTPLLLLLLLPLLPLLQSSLLPSLTLLNADQGAAAADCCKEADSEDPDISSAEAAATGARVEKESRAVDGELRGPVP